MTGRKLSPTGQTRNPEARAWEVDELALCLFILAHIRG